MAVDPGWGPDPAQSQYGIGPRPVSPPFRPPSPPVPDPIGGYHGPGPADSSPGAALQTPQVSGAAASGASGGMGVQPYGPNGTLAVPGGIMSRRYPPGPTGPPTVQPPLGGTGGSAAGGGVGGGAAGVSSLPPGPTGPPTRQGGGVGGAGGLATGLKATNPVPFPAKQEEKMRRQQMGNTNFGLKQRMQGASLGPSSGSSADPYGSDNARAGYGG